MVRIKICGITRSQDAVAAAEAGADAIGLVFARSPRRVTLAVAKRIVRALPPWVSAVGVFVNAKPAAIRRTLDATGIGEAQLHGDESPQILCAMKGVRVIRALRVRGEGVLDELVRWHNAGASGVLLDSFDAAARGGSGRRFDWGLMESLRSGGTLPEGLRLILAGGLTPDNVEAGIRAVRPWGVDVSSGVETRPGVKRDELIQRFVEAARRAGDNRRVNR
ncbi:N-(5'-phosphoribosyl)anthranilate isomerase [Phycisphaerae bacterium RAS2]|nr:N-(5'-phosphoribosyl)anthranilate isomerase [Phycisphaerae bacterium RAS2]